MKIYSEHQDQGESFRKKKCKENLRLEIITVETMTLGCSSNCLLNSYLIEDLQVLKASRLLMTTERQFCANCLYIRSYFCPKKMKTMSKLCSSVLCPTVRFSMGAEDGSESTTFPWSPRPLEASHCWRLGWACPEFHPWERNFVSFNIGHSLEDYLMTTVQVS